MEIEYNGVTLEMTELVECERTAVYDPSGTDLLFVKWRIGCVCTLGSGGYPHATAVNWPGKNNSMTNVRPDLIGTTDKVARDGLRGSDPADYSWDSIKQPHNVDPREPRNPAFITDKELFYRLMTPRKHLKITAYNEDGTKFIWLESPRPLPTDIKGSSQRVGSDTNPAGHQPGTPTDADNGPKPIKCDVVQPTGEAATFGVHFVIETATVPTPAASERLVLSHRWSVTHTHDEDYYLTRITIGEVRFNAAILHAGAQQPDWFRSQFFHPIPLGFRRNGPTVRMSDDGLSLQYEIHDTDPTVTFDPGDSGATQMQIAENVRVLNKQIFPGKLAEFRKEFVEQWLPGLGRWVQTAIPLPGFGKSLRGFLPF